MVVLNLLYSIIGKWYLFEFSGSQKLKYTILKLYNIIVTYLAIYSVNVVINNAKKLR